MPKHPQGAPGRTRALETRNHFTIVHRRPLQLAPTDHRIDYYKLLYKHAKAQHKQISTRQDHHTIVPALVPRVIAAKLVRLVNGDLHVYYRGRDRATVGMRRSWWFVL